MKNGIALVLAGWMMVTAGLGTAQTATPTAPVPAKPAAPAAGQAPARVPLQLQSLDPSTRADPFPPVNPKYFTTNTPTVATVDEYLKAVIGYDQNRIWRVEAIQKTDAPGVSRVVVYVSERTAGAKTQTATFFVTPDGKHAIADQNVTPFGPTPYGERRAALAARANGPARGAASKDLELVEFADLQCPHCKDAQPMMKRLEEDFPKAHIVYQSFSAGRHSSVRVQGGGVRSLRSEEERRRILHLCADGV